MPENFVFNYTNFYKKLLIASQQGFQLLKDRYSSETFYCFAFYSHGSYSFLYASASSEEGLTRVAQRYINDYPKRYGNVPVANIRLLLRHSIADSPLNEPDLVLPIFQEVNELAEKRGAELSEVWSGLAHQYGYERASQLTQAHNDQFLDTCFSVLRQLDEEGLFGVGPVREHILLNFLMGDQSEQECLTYARAINPLSIVRRYQTELKVAWNIGKDLFKTQELE